MRLNFTDHYMNDYITEFKKDLNKIINDLIEKNIINDFNFNKLSIDYSSKSKQGDISTNLFLILLKQNLKKNYDLKDHIFKFLSSLNYIEKIDIVKAGFINVVFKKDFLISKLIDLFSNNEQYGFNNIGNGKKININTQLKAKGSLTKRRGLVLSNALISNKLSSNYSGISEQIFNSQKHLVVQSVEAGVASGKLKSRDIIMYVDGKEIKDLDDLYAYLNNKEQAEFFLRTASFFNDKRAIQKIGKITNKR